MNIPFVDLKAQYNSIKEEINNSIQNVLEDTAFIKGQYVQEFESHFSQEMGISHCIGVGNGTDAITIALRALGLKTGDEVITAANSFIATSEAITNAGGKVVFVDCFPDTYNIDTNLIKEKITKKTKAIIPVHLHGQPVDMDPIMELGKRYNLRIIEDAAQAHLAEYNCNEYGWMPVGTFGDTATFSFFPSKNLGAYGDAGAILTNQAKVAHKARMLSNHGRTSKYDHEFEGVNSRLDGIQAAILSVKLKHLKSWTQKRRDAARNYSEMLSTVPEVIVPVVHPKTNPVWHLYVIRTKRRDALRDFLDQNGISTGIHYPIALPNLQAYKYLGYKSSDFPVATSIQNEILSLPIYPEITVEQIHYVVSKVKEFFKHLD